MLRASLHYLTARRYDIASLTDIEAAEDEVGLLSSASAINEIIKSEIETTPDIGASRIVLGGFSQGAAQSLFTGLSNERKLAGIIGLSSYLPLRKKLKDVSSRVFVAVYNDLRRQGW